MNVKSIAFLNTMYSEYSNVLTKSIPNTPNVVIINPKEIIAPIILNKTVNTRPSEVSPGNL